ncbi:MAG TPA: hypothetical protein VGM14_17715, partial [Streptosporangiaceae bacterium]
PSDRTYHPSDRTYHPSDRTYHPSDRTYHPLDRTYHPLRRLTGGCHGANSPKPGKFQVQWMGSHRNGW